MSEHQDLVIRLRNNVRGTFYSGGKNKKARHKEMDGRLQLQLRDWIVSERNGRRGMMKLLLVLLGNHQREGSHRWVAKLTIRVYVLLKQKIKEEVEE
jgi:hypothetical protein